VAFLLHFCSLGDYFITILTLGGLYCKRLVVCGAFLYFSLYVYVFLFKNPKIKPYLELGLD
jgi:hypothetical protein